MARWKDSRIVNAVGKMARQVAGGTSEEAGSDVVGDRDSEEHKLLRRRMRGLAEPTTVPSTYTCLSLIARAAAMCPASLIRRNREDGNIQPATGAKELERLILQPNPYQTPHEFFAQNFFNLKARGNSFIFIERDNAGKAAGLYCLSANSVQVRQVPPSDSATRNPPWEDEYKYTQARTAADGGWRNTGTGEPTTVKYSDLTAANRWWRGATSIHGWNRPLPGWPMDTDIIPADRMIHVRDISYDGMLGLSPEDLFGEINGLYLGLLLLTTMYSETGGLQGGILSPESATGRARLKQLLDDLRQMAPWSRVFISHGKVDFKAITDSLKDLEALEQSKYTTSQIGRIHGVPPSTLGDDRSQNTARGIEEVNRHFVTTAIRPMQQILGQALRQGIMPNWATQRKAPVEIVWDTRHLTQASTQVRTTYYLRMLEAGVFSANDVRRMEGLPPIEGGDEYVRGLGGGQTSLDDPELGEGEGDPDIPQDDNDTESLP